MRYEKPPQTPQPNNAAGPSRDSPDTAGNGPAGAGLAPESPATDPSGTSDLATQLQAALAESAQSRDSLLRALADTENMRKRSATELVNAHKYAVEGFAANLLQVKDTLEMALADKASTTEQLRMGVDLTLKNLVAAFEKAKVIEVDPLHQKFDPSLHQAVSQVESDQPPNTVVQVFQKGYVLQDRVLRPAMVAVSKAKSAQQIPTQSPVESGDI